MSEQPVAEPERFLVDGEYRSAEECRVLFAKQRLDDHQRRAMDLIEGNIVVDVGCYTGFFVSEASKRYPDKTISGIDYFDDNIRLARMLHPDLRERLRRVSVYRTGFDDESVDCVTMQDVIEHLEGAAAAVKEINRILKPGGFLVVTTPNPFFWRQMLLFFAFEMRNSVLRLFGRRRRMVTQIYFANVEWNRHIYAWTPDTLLTLLVVNGFDYVEHHYERGRSVLERGLLSLFPFLGGTQILKVRKTARAPAEII
jgi:2-polyprenyl-3-methyl-5-hydroxy-6-metoxy-1,4-benzoquinol methylase